MLIDPAALDTLPAAELRAGYAEVVKYGLIGDPAFFAWCEANGAALLAGDDGGAAPRDRDLRRAPRPRSSPGDERDTKGTARLAQFRPQLRPCDRGGDRACAHGEAVAIGMALAFRLSVERGLCPAADAERAIAHLAAVGLPTATDVDPARLAARMAHDKKGAGAGPRPAASAQAFLDA